MSEGDRRVIADISNRILSIGLDPENTKRFLFAAGNIDNKKSDLKQKVWVDRFFLSAGLDNFEQRKGEGRTIADGIRGFLRTETAFGLPLVDTGLLVVNTTSPHTHAQNAFLHADFGLEHTGSAQQSTISVTMGNITYQKKTCDSCAKKDVEVGVFTDAKDYEYIDTRATGQTIGSSRGTIITRDDTGKETGRKEGTVALSSPLRKTAAGGGNPVLKNQDGAIRQGYAGYFVLGNFDPAPQYANEPEPYKEAPLSGGTERSLGGKDTRYAYLRLATANGSSVGSSPADDVPLGPRTDLFIKGWAAGLAEVPSAVPGADKIDVTQIDTDITAENFTIKTHPESNRVKVYVKLFNDLNSKEIHLGGLGKEKTLGPSALVDDQRFAAGTKADPNGPEVAFITGDLVKAGLPQEMQALIPKYDYVKWGFFFGDTNTTPEAREHVHLGTWVGGKIAEPNSFPSTERRTMLAMPWAMCIRMAVCIQPLGPTRIRGTLVKAGARSTWTLIGLNIPYRHSCHGAVYTSMAGSRGMMGVGGLGAYMGILSKEEKSRGKTASGERTTRLGSLAGSRFKGIRVRIPHIVPPAPLRQKERRKSSGVERGASSSPVVLSWVLPPPCHSAGHVHCMGMTVRYLTAWKASIKQTTVIVGVLSTALVALCVSSGLGVGAIAAPTAALPLAQQARTLAATGQVAEALPLAQQALTLAQGEYGPEHEYVGYILDDIATFTYRLGQPEAALSYAQRAVTIVGSQRGETSTQYASVATNLATLLFALGRVQEAEPYYRKSYDIFQQAGGLSHEQTAAAARHLGILYAERSQFAQAQPYFAQALDAYQRVQGQSRVVAQLHLDLAGLFLRQEDLPQARQHAEHAQQILAQPQVGDSESRALARVMLARIALQQSDLPRAESELKEALTTLDATGSPESQARAAVLYNFGFLYILRGQFVEAEPLLKQVLGMYRRLVGEAHPAIARTLHSLAILYKNLGQPQTADDLYQRALQIFTASFGAQDASVAATRLEYALLLTARGEPGKAVAQAEQALAIYQQLSGVWDIKRAYALSSLGFALHRAGALPKAAQALENATQLMTRVRGNTSSDLPPGLTELGEISSKGAWPRQSESCRRRANPRKRRRPDATRVGQNAVRLRATAGPPGADSRGPCAGATLCSGDGGALRSPPTRALPRGPERTP